jgi:hypothetical protein
MYASMAWQTVKICEVCFEINEILFTHSDSNLDANNHGHSDSESGGSNVQSFTNCSSKESELCNALSAYCDGASERGARPSLGIPNTYIG